MKNYQLNRNKKFVDKAHKRFAFLHIKPKFKFALNTVKLIYWNVVKPEPPLHLKEKVENPIKNIFQLTILNKVIR